MNLPSSAREPLAGRKRLEQLQPQTLMIDADDTLWENNIFFERAIDNFVACVSHPELSPSEVRERFNRLESTRVKTHGYGTDAFHHSLLAGFEHLTGAACGAEAAAQIATFATSVREAEMVLLHGVAETLPVLARRHRLILVTKGQTEEQTAKLRRSGLSPHFHHVEVLHEKDVDAYVRLIDRYHSDPAHTWMIGNSPRSDINPAIAAGMHAVYTPHPSTWVLEQEELVAPGDGQILLRLESFGDLLHHFG